MSTYLDVGQWLSYVSGYRKATKLPKTSAAKINEFLRVANDDLRKLIEDATPVFFLFNSEVYQQACIDFSQDLNTSNSGSWEYISHIEKGNINIQKDDKDFYAELQKSLSLYRAPKFNKADIISKIATKKSRITDFSAVVKKNLDILNSKIEREYLPFMADDNPKKDWAAGRARFSTTAAGRSIRTGFQKLTPCVIQDPQQVVSGFNSDTQEILLGSTFSNLRGSVNTILTPIVIKSFKDVGIVLSDTNKKENNPLETKRKFTIGEIVVFGHTGAKTTQDGLAELIGINTPWTQQILLLAAEKGITGEAFNLLNNFAVDSGQVEASVTFTKNVSDDIKVLMKGQLAIVVPMTAKQNKSVLKGETDAANALVESIFGKGSTYIKTRKSLIDRILSAASLRRLVTGLKFSPTLTESLKEGLVSSLKTGNFKKSFAKSPKSTITVTKENIIKNNRPLATPKKIVLPKPKNKSIKRAAIPATRALTNLSDLLIKINANLRDQIKRNMGTGNRRDVLNYQTGRFASSVKVERLSESREGMITMFLTYMKYPYATFSQGGQQQNPKSRDPKLLIAKSVREVASNLVSNRLRAIVI
jgi:hypothetical protein